MRRPLLLLLISSCLVLVAASQSAGNDEALLAKARSSYDAAFTGNLVSFDCSVQFDWKQQFEALVGKNPPPAIVETVEHLQKIQHRVIVNRYGALVATKPNPPKLGEYKSAAQLEQVLNALVTQGLNAWLPFSTNTFLPHKPTKFNFEQIDSGYKLSVTGEGVEATLLLSRDLRVTSGVSQLPQPMRFTASFMDGPRGYLLQSVTTGSTGGTSDGDTTFAFTYQPVQDFQIPASMTVSLSTTTHWRFTLTDCKVVTRTLVPGP